METIDRDEVGLGRCCKLYEMNVPIKKLIDFIDKKVGKLSKFFDHIISTDVALSFKPDHAKKVHIKLGIPDDDLVIERTADTFEDAVVDCVNVLQDHIVKIKGKRYGK